MSYNKLLGSESSFPIALDEFGIKSNFTAENINSYLANIQRLNVLKAKGSLTSSEQTEMMELLDNLSEFMISSNDWNKIAGAMINLQLSLTTVDDKYLEHIEKVISITNDSKSISLGQYTDSYGIEKDIVVDDNAIIKIVVSDGIELIKDVDYIISNDGKYIVRANDDYFYASENDKLQLFVTIDRYVIESNNEEEIGLENINNSLEDALNGK